VSNGIADRRNAEAYLGYSDWRLPNVKELQSIVDDAFYWSGTTHASATGGGAGAYVAFGRSPGYLNGVWVDVHGAGSQRSDPKVGDPADYPTGHGPQGDTIRIFNLARTARGG
jgi:hypothetical protein